MLYLFARALLRVYFRLFRNWEIKGRENVPAEGGFIVVANHVSYWDPPVLGAALPRRVYFMAKIELFRYPLFGSLLRLLGAFPVKRGTVDRSAIKKALAVLQEGKVLGMFPEGTRSRSGELQDPEPGVALLALRTGVPVLPVGIQGTNGQSRLVVRIGKPFILRNEKKKGKEYLEVAGKRIMGEIAALLEKTG